MALPSEAGSRTAWGHECAPLGALLLAAHRGQPPTEAYHPAPRNPGAALRDTPGPPKPPKRELKVGCTRPQHEPISCTRSLHTHRSRENETRVGWSNICANSPPCTAPTPANARSGTRDGHTPQTTLTFTGSDAQRYLQQQSRYAQAALLTPSQVP